MKIYLIILSMIFSFSIVNGVDESDIEEYTTCHLPALVYIFIKMMLYS
jgi:hypothetical protein